MHRESYLTVYTSIVILTSNFSFLISLLLVLFFLVILPPLSSTTFTPDMAVSLAEGVKSGT